MEIEMPIEKCIEHLKANKVPSAKIEHLISDDSHDCQEDCPVVDKCPLKEISK